MTEPWTIESIRDALGNPIVVSRFLAEINRAPAHELLTVFAKWQRIAEDVSAAAARARDLAPYAASGQPLPGQWIDRTDQVRADAERARARGAA
ncbi:hypothetical protein [Streptomyces sp. NPDC020983]|uniref:hypothetical protein n=1 Tax=Streptomyces sp. NPDC020983 TaxID=3365106 RepID=UPI00378E1580